MAPAAGEGTPPVSRRAPGAWMLALLVALGMGFPALYLIAVPRLAVRRERLLAEAPGEPQGRLKLWFVYGQPQIHHALVMARFSAERPWFVTHVVAPSGVGEPPQVWGIDFAGLDPQVARVEGLRVVVTLEAPELLARDVLVGDKVLGVPVFGPGQEPPDPRRLALERLGPYLRRLERGLQRDVPGTSIELRVGGLQGAHAPSQVEGRGA